MLYIINNEYIYILICLYLHQETLEEKAETNKNGYLWRIGENGDEEKGRSESFMSS